MDSSDPRFDVSDPRFNPDQSRPEDQPPAYDAEARRAARPASQNKWMPCLVGCSVVGVFGLIIVALVVGWGWRNWRDLMAMGTSEAMGQLIDNTDLPPQDRQAIKVEVRRVTNAFREGQLTNEQLMRIVHELANSPLLTLFAVSAIEWQFFEQSGLSEEEMRDGRQSLQRFLRGVLDGAIDARAASAVLAHVANRQPDGTWQLRQRVNDQQLRAALAEARQQADEAGIPDEPEPFDAAAEFRRLVDEVLGEA